ncbi:MAG: nicotinate (nicotinamide) nucleotide adenylyltransferase [Chloroflexi bacterium]|nr:nicotinate (nicotinamide) nucleotide adenylyltransferase [Chloroflexota bacterium]
MTKRIGLLGGTFDPPHVGHLWLGETAKDQLHLDEIWFLPVGEPPHKRDRRITAVSHRTTMTHLAIQDTPYFKLNRTDIDRPPPHTTVSLLTKLHQTNLNTQFWLIVGADSLHDFPSWKNPAHLIKLCRIAALGRPGIQLDGEGLETAVPNLRAQVDWLDGPTMDISSTAIRDWARRGSSLKWVVETAVLDYIAQHDLYRD